MEYKYFSAKELQCQHCGADGMNEDFMAKVEYLRHELGFPFKVTSAYRIGGIGVNQKGASRFIHLDDLDQSDSHTRPWVWSY